jgi:hypothetical protein
MILQMSGIKRFERGRGLAVKQLAPLGQDGVLGDFLGECVLEGVLDIASRGLLVYELGKLESMQHAAQVVFRFTGDYPPQKLPA